MHNAGLCFPYLNLKPGLILPWWDPMEVLGTISSLVTTGTGDQFWYEF